MNEALRKVQKGGDGQGRMVLREGAVQRRGRGTDADATLCAVDKHFAEDEHPDRGPTSFLYPSTLRFSTTTCTLDSCVAATRCISFSSLCYASQYLINCPSQSMTRPDEFEPRRAATYMMLAADLAVEISGLGYHRSPERCKCHIIV